MASAITYHPPLAPTEIQRQIPSVGAVCGKVARTALCGGREVTCVPTATAHAVDLQHTRSSESAPCPRAPRASKTRGHGATIDHLFVRPLCQAPLPTLRFCALFMVP